MEKIGYGAGVFALRGFLAPEECQRYIRQSEGMGYEEAAIQTRHGPELIKTVRNNDRVIFDDPALAASLYQRAQPWLPATLGKGQVCGLNERFRFYRYTPGQFFRWHKDGSYARSEHEASALSFLIYLNDGFTGGATAFSWDVVTPEQGMALVFPHWMMHQGNAVDSGVKYMLRTDVMYREALDQQQ